MIESIRIQNEASFGGTPQHLTDLSQHNFIFGANGTGKTTISRIIADESAFPHCSVNWGGRVKVEALVYNRDFVEKHFDQPSELTGIFTLGEEDKDALTKISTAKSELDALAEDIQKLSITLEGKDGEVGKRSELVVLEEGFEVRCWALKQKHDAKLQGAFRGFRNAKLAFKKELLKQAKSNSAELPSLAELEQRAETVFGSAPERAVAISVPEYEDLLELESNPILKKKIVGRADVDIAAMIQELGNSDWVKQGQAFYAANDKVCPFCQQNTEESFAASLNQYFDDTFESDTKTIEQLYVDYESRSERLTQSFQQILLLPPVFLDADKLKSEKELIEAKFRTNLQEIQTKRHEPSRSVDLDPLSDAMTAAKNLIEAANRSIKDHNEMVVNLAREKRVLTEQVWKFLLESEIKSDLATYEKTKDDLSKAIKSLTAQIGEKGKAKRDKEAEIRELEKVTTSIQPTIDQINALLRTFGFNNFALAKADKERYYKIVRPDGTDAKETLSEGEKNFITFLYFYHLLKGSKSETGMTTDRVVVFDDPVSSLDSDVLFIVATLIKGLLEEARAGSGQIKQVFVLTHNVYFHREVSFSSRRPIGGTMREETFWIVRKSNDLSVLEKYDTNPIKTSYELLWMQVRSADPSNLTIQNTLRRILENYFTILGGVDPGEVCAKFEGEEKLICRSLFSWINAGSHFAHDDLYVSVDSRSIENSLRVFRQVFAKMGHIAHYKMMMRGDDLEGES